MDGLKDSGQAVGAQVLTELTGFAPPTIMAQAARLQARQRLFNLVVTNVPGPQFPLYMLSRQLEAMYPMVPLAENQALGIAIMSYNGQLNFGLNADYDAIGDLEALADELRASIEELAAAAGRGPGPDPADGAPSPPPTEISLQPVNRRGRSPMRLVERVVIVILAFALAVGIIAVLSGGLLAGRDNPGITGQTGSLGAQFRDLGHAHLTPGAPHPAYDSRPPTSGAHVPVAITRNASQIWISMLALTASAWARCSAL